MVPSGPPAPVGGARSVSPVLLRSNSGILVQGGQVGNVPSQTPFASLVSAQNQFGNSNSISFLGNMANVSSLLAQTLGGNGGQLPGIGLSADHMNLQQRRAASGNAMEIAGPSGSCHLSYNSSGQGQMQSFAGSPMSQMPENTPTQQNVEASNFQHQFSAPHCKQQLRGAICNIPVKLEPHSSASDQNGLQQQLPALRNVESMKLEPQQIQSLRSLAQVKLEHQQNSDPSLYLQQQHQQQLMHMSRQPSQPAAQMNLLQQQQQRIRQMHQEHQQQQSQLQQQQLQQALSLRPQIKSYEPGTCARRLTHYMYNQRHRPADNGIDFWRTFVNEYFAPHAKKRWCVSLYGSGRQTTAIIPQDVWHCDICDRKPGRGFETTVEVLPRLCKIKYDSGTLEELLYVDMPQEYQNSSGRIVLDYPKAIQVSVFEQLRVVREGHLRIVFNSDLKICSWEFCARRHEELIPRRLIVPQVSQLGTVAQKYQSASQNASSNSGLPAQELQSTCNSFVASARQMAKALEVPLVNDLGYTKRYVRCLQISEVVNSMKDLIDYSRETGTGPMASLANFPRRTPTSSVLPQSMPQPYHQQSVIQVQSSNTNDSNAVQVSNMQLASSNGAMSANMASNAACSAASSTIAGILHQNSMNSRHDNQVGNMNNSSGSGNTGQIPSAGSSSSLPQNQLNPSSPPFSSTPTGTNNNPPQASHDSSVINTSNSTGNILSMQQSTGPADEVDQVRSQTSMPQIMHRMIMSGQMPGVGFLGNDVKGINGLTPALNGGNHPIGTVLAGNSVSMNCGGIDFGSTATANSIRASTMNNAMALGARGALSQMSQVPPSMNLQQQQEFANRLVNNGFGRVNGFSNMSFDWKTTP